MCECERDCVRAKEVDMYEIDRESVCEGVQVCVRENM